MVLQSWKSSTQDGEGEDLYLILGHTQRPLSQIQNKTEGKEETDRIYGCLEISELWVECLPTTPVAQDEIPNTP